MSVKSEDFLFFFLVDQSAIDVIMANSFIPDCVWMVCLSVKNKERSWSLENVSCSIIFYSIFTNILDLSVRELYAMLGKLLKKGN